MITNEEETPEERELMKTREHPANRQQRRAIAKRAGVRFSVVNPEMKHKPQVYLGINAFKKSTKNKKLVETYKNNAHQSLKELQIRRAIEQADMNAGVEIPKKAMKKLRGKHERNANRRRASDAPV